MIHRSVKHNEAEEEYVSEIGEMHEDEAATSRMSPSSAQDNSEADTEMTFEDEVEIILDLDNDSTFYSISNNFPSSPLLNITVESPSENSDSGYGSDTSFCFPVAASPQSPSSDVDWLAKCLGKTATISHEK